MGQAKIDALATEEYHPKYQTHADDSAVKEAVRVIVASERAKKLDELQTSRGIRTRIHELLQSRAKVPNLPLEGAKNATEMRAQLELHHDHQTAHFQALWQHADELARRAT